MTRCRILGQKLLSRSPLRLRWLAIALVWVGVGGTPGNAQELATHGHFIRLSYIPGRVTSTAAFLNGSNLNGRSIRGSHSLRMEFGWQTDGSEDWHRAYNRPSYGVGVSVTRFANGQELGAPLAVYVFGDWPLVRRNRYTLNFAGAFGLAANLNGFDPETNPFNYMTSDRAFQVDLGMSFEYRLSARLAVAAGMGFTHFSNGGGSDPNQGMEIVKLALSGRYGLDAEPLEVHAGKAEPFRKEWLVSVSAGMGARGTPALETSSPDGRPSDNFGVAELSFGFGRRLGHMATVVGGVDLTYDGSLLRDPEPVKSVSQVTASPGDARVSLADRSALSLFAGYEHVFGSATVVAHLGYTIARGVEHSEYPRYFQRIGLRFALLRGVSVGLAIRNAGLFQHAVFPTLSAGYRWTWR